MDATGELASFIVGDAAGSAPPSVHEAVEHALLNAIAVGVQAATHDGIENARAVVPKGARESHSFGGQHAMAAKWAAFLNGMAAQLGEPGEQCGRLRVEVGASVVPAALAAAETNDSRGRDLLDAMIVGAEVSARLTTLLGIAHLERGWCPSGTAGVVGAFAAAARLFKLERHAVQMGIGIAATQAAGLSKSAGTLSRPIQSGKAALNGVEAATLASQGFGASNQSIDGRRGFLELLTGTPDHLAMSQLGSTWLIEELHVGRFACCGEAQSIVNAALALTPRNLERTSRIRVMVHPLTRALMRYDDPRTPEEAKFSATHCAAVALVDADAGAAQFSMERVTDSRVSRLRGLAQLVADPDLPLGAARVEILEGGRAESATADLDHAAMDRAGVIRKATALLGPRFGRSSSAIVDRCLGLGEVASARELGRAIS